MADSWWRDGFLMEVWSTLKPFLGSQILCIMCAHKCKNLYVKISKIVPNIWAHCGQQRAPNYNSALTDTQCDRIMWIIPYLVMGRILKIRQFSWQNFISTYRAWVCAQKILWFCMLMKSAVTTTAQYNCQIKHTKETPKWHGGSCQLHTISQ